LKYSRQIESFSVFDVCAGRLQDISASERLFRIVKHGHRLSYTPHPGESDRRISSCGVAKTACLQRREQFVCLLGLAQREK